VILVAGFVALIVMIIFGAMKSSDVYKSALNKAKTDPRVINVLGSPIKEGMFVSGNTSVNGASGQADLAVPISGPKGKGTIYIVASKSAGLWSYSTLVVEVQETKERINLNENKLLRGNQANPR
jgi:hypothetical protein